ncbi:MAG TPA: TIGR03085 family metal-binding protein [Acidimicrobiales bacterium]
MADAPRDARPDGSSAAPGYGPLDARERSELCDLFLAVGPEAPTLCEGWSTLDLAAHLVVREHDPRSGLAILGGERFAKLEHSLMDGARSQGYEHLVDRLRAGPPLVPWRLPLLRQALNLTEWFVHHEDVRRPAGEGPRSDRPDLDSTFWTMLRRTSRLMLRKVRGAGVALEAPGFGEVAARGPGPSVRLTGGPQELLLYLNGRRTAARVDITGPEEARAIVESAPLGF